MQSKVKPLHSKVSETSSAVELAVGKLSSMESKLKDLEERLRSLAQAYEDASIDKCRQYELTETLGSQLSQAAYFEQVGKQKKYGIMLYESPITSTAVMKIVYWCTKVLQYLLRIGQFSCCLIPLCPTSHFHLRGFAGGLLLKQRHNVTRKWRIVCSKYIHQVWVMDCDEVGVFWNRELA